MCDNTVQYCDDDITWNKQANIEVCILLTKQLMMAKF